MNSSFATIDAGSPWRHSKPCSASGPDVSRRHIRRYGAARPLNAVQQRLSAIYWGPLKQPDKHKPPKVNPPDNQFFERVTLARMAMPYMAKL